MYYRCQLLLISKYMYVSIVLYVYTYTYTHTLEKNFRTFSTPIPPSVDHSWLVFRGTLILSCISLGLFPLNTDRHTVPCMQRQLNKQELQELYLKSNSWNTHVIKINCWKLTIYIQVYDALLAPKFRLITPASPILSHEYTAFSKTVALIHHLITL